MNTAQRLGRLGLIVAVAGGSVAGFTGAARAAATITVTTRVDDGGSGTAANCPGAACSLRDAIADANANPGTTISVPAGVFALAGTQLSISAPMTISGAGAGAPAGTVIEQAAHSGARVLLVGNSTGNVTVSGVEIMGGNLTQGGDADGGGVLVSGSSGSTVTLTDDLIDHNSATGSAGASPGAAGSEAGGGGVTVAGQGDFVLSGTGVTDNTATGGAGASAPSGSGGQGGDVWGAGVDFYSTGTLSIGAGSSIAGNTGTGGAGGTAAAGHPVGQSGTALGGGLSITQAVIATSASIAGATITGNSVTGAAGAHAVSGQPDGTGAGADGAGVYVELDGPLSISGSSISGNTATSGAMGGGGTATDGGVAAGGALWLTATDATITQSTIANDVANGTATGASAQGGGIWTQAPTTIVNSTLTGDVTGSSAGFSEAGGAIFTSRPTTLASDTIDGNTGTYGANVYAEAAVTFGSTIVANPAGGGTNCYASGGSFIDLTARGGNLEDDSAGSCGFLAAKGDILGKSPALGALAADGGLGMTMVPQPGSAAIGAGGACVDPTASPAGSLTVDERTQPRPAGGPCDIGAVQVQAPRATTAPSASPSTGAPGATLTCNPGSWSGDGTVALTYAWQRDGAAIAGQTGATYVTSAADSGHKLTCVVTATSNYGLKASAATAPVVVSAAGPAGSGAPPSSGSGAPGGTPPAGGGTPPLTGSGSELSLTARESHASWRTHGRPRRHAKPVGTRFAIALSADAHITLTFKHAGRHGKTVGHVTISGRGGSNAVRFSGHLGHGHTLRPGRYVVAIVARTASGARSRTVRLSFTVAK